MKRNDVIWRDWLSIIVRKPNIIDYMRIYSRAGVKPPYDSVYVYVYVTFLYSIDDSVFKQIRSLTESSEFSSFMDERFASVTHSQAPSPFPTRNPLKRSIKSTNISNVLHRTSSTLVF